MPLAVGEIDDQAEGEPEEEAKPGIERKKEHHRHVHENAERRHDADCRTPEWALRFGTAAQPNKPARSTVKVAGLATPGALVEIEMIAVKKLP